VKEKGEIIERLISIVGKENVRINEPMKNHTSFKVGGPADVLVTPVTDIQIIDVLKLCRDGQYPVYIMGNGTNLVVRDKGIRGVVVKILDKYNSIWMDGGLLVAEAGALLSNLSRFALKESLKGLEFASGIPGTVGGAIAMNAGAYNGEIKDVIYSADVIDNEFNIITLNKEELDLGYRSSIVSKKGYIVVRARFKLEHGDYEQIKSRIDNLTIRRKERQPLNLPSAGSTFKRPEGHFAAKLIEDAGLKGRRVGGAAVSEMHSGFIVNDRNGSAKDILDLIEEVKKEVQDKFGVTLEPEVKVIGEE